MIIEFVSLHGGEDRPLQGKQTDIQGIALVDHIKVQVVKTLPK